MKTESLILASILVLSACNKENVPSIHDRIPVKIDFVERVLDENVDIGSELFDYVEAVDLGLSVKWASVNLGATKPSEQGKHYAWGEILSSEKFGWQYYEHNESPCSCSNILYLNKYCFDKYGEINDVNAGAELDKLDDAAYIALGGQWRTPSADEYAELIEKCEWTYNEQNKTFEATGPNGNSIQFPAPGYSIGTTKYSAEDVIGYATGGYWTRELSDFSSADAKMILMYYTNGECDIKISPGYNRCFGLPIRAITQ